MTLFALEPSPSSVELPGVSQHHPEHIPSPEPVRPQRCPSSVLQPKLSIWPVAGSHQHILTELLPASPKELILVGTARGVHGWGPGVFGAVGAAGVFAGAAGETAVLPLSSHC